MPAPPAASTGSNRQSAMYDPFATDFSSPTSSPAAPAAPVTETVTETLPPPAGTPPKRARPSRWGRRHGLEQGAGSGSGFPGSAAAAGGSAGLADVSGGAAQAARQPPPAGAAPAPNAGLRLEAAAAQAPSGLGAQGAPATSAAPAVQYKGPNGEMYPPPPPGGVPEDALAALRAAMDAMSDPESPPPPLPAGADGAASTAPPYGLTYGLRPELRAAWGLPHPDDLGASAQRGSRAPKGTDPGMYPSSSPSNGAAAAPRAPAPPYPP